MANGQDTSPAPVLAVGLGRGFGGKSTGLAELVWRARNQGRSVIVADGDARSKTLAGIFPTPPSRRLRSCPISRRGSIPC
jgi:MinD-like ATPase involved in chromosome partitioning or flagellar assembly